MHPDGYVELRDRLKDVIISGGENISTIEVEQALSAHPASPRRPWWAAPTRSGARCRWRSWWRRRHCRRRRPSCGTSWASSSPGSRSRSGIELVDDLPKTGTGKVQKFALREREAAR
jgi:fatty-acyl-CoA synthase